MQFKRDYVQCCLRAKLSGKMQIFNLNPDALEIVFVDGSITIMDLDFSQGFYSKSQKIIQERGGKSVLKIYDLLSDLAEEMWILGLNQYQ